MVLALAPAGLYGLAVTDDELQALPCLRPQAPTVPYTVTLRVDYRRMHEDDPSLHAYHWLEAQTRHRTGYSAPVHLACHHQACMDYVREQSERLGVPASIPAVAALSIGPEHVLWHNRTDPYARPFGLPQLTELLDRTTATTTPEEG